MKTIKKEFKSIALIVGVLIFFQGCTVYKSASVTLDEAYKSQTKVKVKTKDNRTYKFKKLEFKDGQYVGINELYKDDAFNIYNKQIIETQLDVSNVEMIKIKNKTMSTVLPFAIPIALLSIGIALYTMPTW
jgi:hypothetical protein